MLKAQGLEYETHGEGEPVLLIHGSHVADSFLPLTREAVLADRYKTHPVSSPRVCRQRSACGIVQHRRPSAISMRWRCCKCSACNVRT